MHCVREQLLSSGYEVTLKDTDIAVPRALVMEVIVESRAYAKHCTACLSGSDLAPKDSKYGIILG